MGYVRLMDYTAHEPSRQSPAKLPPSAPACIRTIVCEWVILSVSRTWEVPTPGNRDSGTPPNTGLTGTRSKGLTCPRCSATWLGVTLLGTVATLGNMRRKQGDSGRTATHLAPCIVSRTSEGHIRRSDTMNSKREITLDKTLVLIGWMFENGDGLSVTSPLSKRGEHGLSLESHKA
ncbi:hypothetical protein NEUTE1DRAFT_122138 [Neurospora tetrasperma FGSC 2508]|uniref:Uncharacterized protein n=1 Tax=Neurospora tetrasperma (strain FGSC 2508 / ATCC MYA-4615 / P0657) TaxID=510951 RepID=F8MMA2_NEUT8|nr:uncharacterized protein NEUTE1DRAFT_122138 [Neurospora tetrasperma FGSC 2508]EGO57776.1 hypothetical protein NEUTE1DRAFT_122138 [Neurospora tetrasperma FGSC 2508]